MGLESGTGNGKKRRSYRPTVEALEALRMLSSAAQVLPHLAVERDILEGTGPVALDPAGLSSATWDAALVQTRLADLLGTSSTAADADAISAGLSQLNRYLNRAWARAGIPVQMYDDSSQAVYVTLLENLGRTRFDDMLAEIGQFGIRNVLSRETSEGPDFFRAIDTIKKRAQRQRTFQSLDLVEASATARPDSTLDHRRGALQEAIDQSLNPREAALVYETLMGKTPAEIASQWGVAPKTVSNEKTRVIQKLRGLFDAAGD
jgi:hypothetical protein